VTAISAPDPGKPVFQNPAIQIPINHLFDIGTKKAVSSLKPLFINLFKRFEVVLHAPIIRRVLRLPLPVDGCCHGDRYQYVSENETYPAANSVPTLHFQSSISAKELPQQYEVEFNLTHKINFLILLTQKRKFLSTQEIWAEIRKYGTLRAVLPWPISPWQPRKSGPIEMERGRIERSGTGSLPLESSLKSVRNI